VIRERVKLGPECVVGNGVVIHPDSEIGRGVRMDDNAVVGKLPMRGAISVLKETPELPAARIGDGCIIGTSSVVYRGAEIGAKVLIADLATVRENVRIGECTIIGRGVTVENLCNIGCFCKLETESYITAYSILEDYVFIAPQVSTSNDNFVGRTKERFKHYRGVTVKRGGRIGTGAVILPGTCIGEDALVAAGALVTRDVPPRKIVIGVPARVWKDVPREQLLENQ
jgi:UDP-2-acetamido-3-amino-2,3-dideoxy-glucuronate N-acetyltransferase